MCISICIFASNCAFSEYFEIFRLINIIIPVINEKSMALLVARSLGFGLTRWSMGRGVDPFAGKGDHLWGSADPC